MFLTSAAELNVLRYVGGFLDQCMHRIPQLFGDSDVFGDTGALCRDYANFLCRYYAETSAFRRECVRLSCDNGAASAHDRERACLINVHVCKCARSEVTNHALLAVSRNLHSSGACALRPRHPRRP